jgi:tetratricopeptide (TPR) repeat protein
MKPKTVPAISLFSLAVFFTLLTAPAVAQDIKAALALNKEGENLLEGGRLEEALGTFTKMLDACGSHEFCSGAARFYIGRSHYESGRCDKAMSFFDEAEPIFTKLNKKDQLGSVLLSKGKAYAGLSNYQRALECFIEAEKIFSETQNRNELFAVFNSVAVVHAYMGDYDAAIQYLGKAEKILDGAKDSKLPAALDNNMALVCAKRQQYDQAFTCYGRALKHYETCGDLKGMSITLTNTGQLHESRSEYAKALECHNRSLDLARKAGDRASEALALNNIGWVELKRGNYAAAQKAYEESYNIRKTLGAQHFAAEGLNNIGLVWLAYGDYPRAAQCFEQSMAGCDAAGAVAGRAWALHNLAFVYKDQGKFKESLAASQAAVDIAQRIGDRRMEATAILRLGNLYEYQGWYDKALDNYKKAASIQTDICDWNFGSNTLSDMAGILTRNGDLEEAAKYYQDAVTLRRRIGAPYADLLCKFALFFVEAHRYGEQDDVGPEAKQKAREAAFANALQRVQEAEKLIAEDQKQDLMLLTYVRAKLRLEKDPDAALKDFTRLKSLAESASVRKYAFLASVGAGLAQERLQQWSLAEKSFRDAVDYAEQIRQSLDPYSRTTFLDGEVILGVKHVAPYEGLARVLMQMGKTEESLKSAEYTKARAFAEALAARPDAESTDAPQEVLVRDAGFNSRLAGVMSGLEKAYEQGSRDAIESLKKEKEALLEEMTRHVKDLRAKHPLFAAVKYPEPMDIAQTALRDREWALVYDLTDSGALIYLLNGAKIVKAVFTPVPRAEVDRLVRKFREPLEMSGADDFVQKLASFDFASGKKLSDLLLGEILPHLPAGAPLLIAPDDSLGVLPFEMLVLNDSGKVATDRNVPYVTSAEFMGDRNPIYYYQSITALTLARTLGEKQKPGEQMLVMADPVFQHQDARAQPVSNIVVAQAEKDFSIMLMSHLESAMGSGFSFERLPGTGELADNLFKIFDGEPSIRTGLAASKKSFFEELVHGRAKYGKIVVATHGLFTRDIPALREPVLVLTLTPAGTDGFVRMSEVTGLRMNADVVALTACQTGLGRHISGEGTMGMGRAFQYAGARTVLMTLWSVAEETSVKLVEAFFKHLKSGKGKLEAIKLARHEVRAEGFDHPFFWAAFILAGEPN